MTTTTPDLIYSPDNTAGIDQLHTELATTASSVQTAFDTRVIKTFKWADNAARTAQTGMTAGDEGYQTDTDTAYRYDGAAWVSPLASTLITVTRLVETQRFTSATSVVLDDVFDSGSDIYQIVLSSKGSNSSVSFQLRAGGVDTTVGYDRTEALNRDGSSSSSTLTNNNPLVVSGVTSGLLQSELLVTNPASLVETRIVGHTGSHTNPGGQNILNALVGAYGSHRGVTSFDGFKILFSATQTGFISVYRLPQ